MAFTTIKKPSDYFNTVLYTGTGSSNAITGVGFQPDWTWIKNRSTVNNHRLFDAVRGANKNIKSNDSQAEITASDQLMSFDSDGFTLGADGSVNESGNNIVSWNWLTDNTSGSSNTQGDIASTVSANTTSGFSIVSYTGTGSNATVGHSLGSVAKMIMVKRRDTTGRWQVYHNGLGATKYLFLDGTEAEQTNSNRWNDTNPTSSVFSLGSSAEVNASGGTFVAYCFANVKGFSKFGYYKANADNNGPMIYLGFKPALVIIKKTNGTNPWIILDNKRGSYNVNQSKLFADSSNAENTDTSNGIDFLSNGLKIRRNNTEINGAAGDSFIYMAFAEEPLVGDNPATAR